MSIPSIILFLCQGSLACWECRAELGAHPYCLCFLCDLYSSERMVSLRSFDWKRKKKGNLSIRIWHLDVCYIQHLSNGRRQMFGSCSSVVWMSCWPLWEMGMCSAISFWLSSFSSVVVMLLSNFLTFSRNNLALCICMWNCDMLRLGFLLTHWSFAGKLSAAAKLVNLSGNTF